MKRTMPILVLAGGLLLVSSIFLGLAMDHHRRHRLDTAIKATGPLKITENDSPLQGQPTIGPFKIEKKGWSVSVTPVASYSTQGIIVGIKKYHDNPNSIFCPYDAAIAFGLMSREDYRAPLTFSQSNRFANYRFGGTLPYPQQTIDYNVSNNHLMPVNETVAEGISRIRKGDTVRLTGQLINIHAEKGGRFFNWNTSTTRFDTMNGACEIIYVETVTINDQLFS